MPIELQLRLPPGREPNEREDGERLLEAAMRATRLEREQIAAVRVRKVSFDARRRERNWLVRLEVFRRGEECPAQPRSQAPRYAPAAPDAPHVLVVGAGPAGLFCALDLVAAGVRVTLLDRGGDVQERRLPLARLNRGQGVDPDSNYCFGEGGAGTYSDGKLYTRSGRKRDVRAVLETLVAHGARTDLLTSWRPHVGSNKLPEVVRALRETLVAAGAQVRFHARVEDLVLAAEKPPRVTGALYRDLATPDAELQTVSADAVVLAPGHSARDTLELAARAGARLEAKGFALGVRIEHPQPWLDELQYGGLRATCDLPASFYEVVEQVDERGVYSFCMCPGGWIVPATTAADRVVANGMSLSRRDSPHANSGLVVQIEPEDWCGAAGRAAGWAELTGGVPETPQVDPLFGVRLQEALERTCAQAGGGALKLPAQRADAFLNKGGATALPRTSYRPGVTALALDQVLPPAVAQRLREGLHAFDQRMPGFAGDSGVIVAPESRTSSPVRMARDRESLVAVAVSGQPLSGLYPCGEGAGFAGGIVSAAVDGRRAAASVLQRVR